jgi:hypothetical protein
MIPRPLEQAEKAGGRPNPQCSSLFSVECQAWCGVVLHVFPNPKGLNLPALGCEARATQGAKTEKSQTLKGFHRLHNNIFVCSMNWRWTSFQFIGQRRGDPVPRLLRRRVRQADDDYDGPTPAGLTFLRRH